MDLEKIDVTINKNIYDYKNCSTIKLKTFVNYIKKGKYRTIVEQHRKRMYDDDYDGYLKKSLPKVLIDGTYKTRSHEGLISLNGIMLFDVDDVSDYNRLKELIIKLTNPFILFRSTSNDIKFGYLTDLYETDYYEVGYKYILENIEKSLKLYKDIENLSYKFDYISYGLGTFMSYDPDIIFNSVNYNILQIKDIIKEQVEINKLKNKTQRFKSNTVNYNSNNSKKIKNIIKWLHEKDICITETYWDWQNIAMALYNTFTDFEEATNYFYDFSSTWEHFNENDFNHEVIKFKKMIEDGNLENKITIGSIIYKVKKIGYNETKQVLKR